MQSRYLYP